MEQQQECGVVPWAIGDSEEDIWLSACCVCGHSQQDLQRCSGCPRVFHLDCVHPSDYKVFVARNSKNTPSVLCPECCERLQSDEQYYREDVQNQISVILERCEQFPSGHPISILAETLRIIIKRCRHNQLDPDNLTFNRFIDVNLLKDSSNYKQLSLEEGKLKIKNQGCEDVCELLLEISKKQPSSPVICQKLQEVFPLPSSRNWVTVFLRDGVCTPPMCKISKVQIAALKTYVCSRFNQHINTINERNLKRKLVEGGFKEIRLNYYMRFEMTLNEIKKNSIFADTFGGGAPWMRIVNQVLGTDCELSEIICQITKPGAPPQSINSDEKCQNLNQNQRHKSPYAITVFIPLTDLQAGMQGWNGAFEFHVGSQLNYDGTQQEDDGQQKNVKVIVALQTGQCALVDFRLQYRCLENSSRNETIVLSLIYCKKGFGGRFTEDTTSHSPSLPARTKGPHIQVQDQKRQATSGQLQDSDKFIVQPHKKCKVILQEQKRQDDVQVIPRSAAAKIATTKDIMILRNGVKNSGLSKPLRVEVTSSKQQHKEIIIRQQYPLSKTTKVEVLAENNATSTENPPIKQSHVQDEYEFVEGASLNHNQDRNSNKQQNGSYEEGIVVAGRMLRATVSRKATVSEMRQLQCQAAQK